MTLPELNPAYVFYGAIVGIIFVAADAIYLLAFGSDAYRKTVNRRLSKLERSASRDEAIIQLRRERHLGSEFAKHRLAAWFIRLLTQSGVTLSMPKLALVCAAAGVTACALAFAWTGDLFKAVLAMLFAGLVMPILALRRLRKRRCAKFTEQLPEALDLIVRSLRAGHPVPASIKLTAREFRDPLGSEFGIVDDEITYGLDLETALRNMLDRVGQEDLPLFAASVAIQASSGGNLTEILANLCEVIRSRVKMRRKVRALSSEGRASAMILTSVPIVLFLLINWMSPSFYGAHWGHPWMIKGLAGAGVWMTIGNLVMRRMINFKF